MKEELFINTISLSRAEFLVYLFLAVIIGWAIKSISRKTWKHRPWDHNSRAVHYVQYIPEEHQPKTYL